MKRIFNDKRGKAVGGMKISEEFMASILALIILGFIVVVIVGNFIAIGGNVMPTIDGGRVINESTVAVVNETGVILTKGSLFTPVCTIITVSNNTGDMVIVAANYTLTGTGGCRIGFDPTATGGAASVNNTVWNVTYSHTYKQGEVVELGQNVSIGVSGFFANTTTWFALLSIVIIISIVIIVARIGRGAGKGKREQDL